MVLKSERVIPALRSRYCGMAWYFSNSACQAAASSGGTTPVTGFHSTIERPDSVRRVAPPTTNVATISAATASSHSRMAWRRVAGVAGTLVMRRSGHALCRFRRGTYICGPVLAIEPKLHAHPPAQAHRCGRAHRPGADVGAGRHGAGAIAGGQGQRPPRSDLLRGGWARLGAAGYAAGEMDVAISESLSRRRRPAGSRSRARLPPPTSAPAHSAAAGARR